MLADLPVEYRLRVCGLVGFVVAVTAVTDEVDDDIAVELLTEDHRETGNGEARLRIIGIDVKHRDVETARNVTGVIRGTRLTRIRREADLIVRDDVQRAASAVTAQASEVERLGNDALAGERRVAVNDDGYDEILILLQLGSGTIRLLRAGDAFDHGMHELEMARIRREHDGEWLAAGRRIRALCAEVIFHIAGAGHLRVNSFEFRDDVAVRHAERVREHIEAPAMRHADGDFTRAGCGSAFDGEVEHGHHHVGALDREALRAEVCAMDELLQRLDFRQAAQQPLLFLGAEWLTVRAGFDLFAQPFARLRILEMLVLVADRARVRVLQPVQHLGHRVTGQIIDER
jgi:hypothetical protein